MGNVSKKQKNSNPAKKIVRKFQNDYPLNQEKKLSEIPGWDEVLVDTKGFVPLDVKFKQLEEAGIKAEFNIADLDSSQIRQVFLNPDFEITPDDDLEDIQEKLYQRELFKQQLMAQNVKRDEKSHNDAKTQKEPSNDVSNKVHADKVSPECLPGHHQG